MKKRRTSPWFYALMIGIGIFVFAVAVMRHDETSTEGASPLSTTSAAVFLVFVTLGPGLLAKEVVARMVPVEQLAKDRRRLRKNLRTAQRSQQRAVDRMEQLVLERDWHRQESTQIRAVYLLAYREAGGTLPPDNPYAEFPRKVS